MAAMSSPVSMTVPDVRSVAVAVVIVASTAARVRAACCS